MVLKQFRRVVCVPGDVETRYIARVTGRREEI